MSPSGSRAATLPRLQAALLTAWRSSLPREEWQQLNLSALRRACAAQLQFGLRRRPGQTLVRVVDPSAAVPQPQAASRCVIELITEDMPFLVDTLQLCIQQAGFHIQQLVHPILRVQRDAGGRLLALSGHARHGSEAAIGTRGQRALPESAPHESWQHLSIDQVGGESERRALLRQLRAALADLRCAWRDWSAMRSSVLELCAEMERHPPPLPREAVTESTALLRYMEAHHFTFLGLRDSRLRRGPQGPELVTVPDSQLGLLRRVARGATSTHAAGVTGRDIRLALRSREPLVITQANLRSTVHRAGYLDYVGVKRYDAAGRIIGETRILGLWTSSVYRADARQLPWVRLKLARVIEHFPFPAESHDGKRLVHILETLPRDELLQASISDLVRCARAVLALQEGAPRVRLVLRRDEFHRFWSCLVFLPRERCDSAAEQRIGELLRVALQGGAVDSRLALGEAPLAQLHIVVRVQHPQATRPDAKRLERLIAAALVSWRDRLRAALCKRFAEAAAVVLERRYGSAFPDAYREDVHAELAVEDIADLEDLDRAPEHMQLRLYRPPHQSPQRLHLRILRRGEALSVAEVLPTFEHFGLRVIAERPYRLAPAGSAAAWVQDFELEHSTRQPIPLARVGTEIVAAFRAVRAGELDDDGFNRLLIAARLNARQGSVLRACCRYLLQTGIPFSQSYMERVLEEHAATAGELVELFEARLAPQRSRRLEARIAQLERRIRRAISAVVSADDDRILRAFLAVIGASLRTNYFVRDARGQARPWLSIKLDPATIPGLPPPRPAFEIYVYSPRVEGVHLRMGPIARGGIRWSERPEDFRTEILGLMKAQHVKNTLIVPVGAKGGFVARRLQPRASRERVQSEVVECYRSFIRGLLDLTDNIVGQQIVPPLQVRRLDGDDPYLVVAADKGTASFSDIANAIAAEYRFWLGDAFASGGSAGYDHKKMGITARGAWVCILRHFRELGRDAQRESITVAGIGDMSGDVFGNGMLLSRHIRLLAAFNHQHIFLDPHPDPRRSYAERTRLFRLPRSGWQDYQRQLLSRGGAIYERTAKSVQLSREAQQMLDLPQRRTTPSELIRAILCMQVDLLWNGGIGTYVKASSERHGEIGDRANDAVRVDGREVRARVVGEGGNLGFSQRGRIEYAGRGGLLNTDFIDNSAGVNTSDVEVNLKILLDGDDGAPLAPARRNRLLRAATPEVARLVLRNNYLQTQAISVMAQRAASDLSEHQRLLHWLERHGELDRAVEFLPSDEEIDERRRQGRGLTRPELALLLSYGKIALNHALTQAGSAADPYLARELQRYFPLALRRSFAQRIEHHRLRSQIIVTAITNSCVNRVGPTLLMECTEHSGASPAAVARAYTIARDSADLRELWSQIESLDGQVKAEHQYQALWASSRLLRHLTLWLLSRHREYPAIGAAVSRLQPALRGFVEVLPGALAGLDRDHYLAERQRHVEQGFPPRLAERLAILEPLRVAASLSELTRGGRLSARIVAHAHFGLAARLGLDWLNAAIERLAASDDWQRAAKARLQSAALTAQLRMTAMALRVPAGSGSLGVHKSALQRWQQILSDLRALPVADAPTLLVAVEALENLAAGRSQASAHLL